MGVVAGFDTAIIISHSMRKSNVSLNTAEVGGGGGERGAC